MHRALILLLFGLVLAGGAAVTWQAMGRAKLVEEDLTTARALLARAGVTLFKQQQVGTPEVTVEAPGGGDGPAPVALTARPCHHPSGW